MLGIAKVASGKTALGSLNMVWEPKANKSKISELQDRPKYLFRRG